IAVASCSPIVTPKTCPRLEAGSVLTSKTVRPLSASATAVAHARDVLPTPPLPVKNRSRVGCCKRRIFNLQSGIQEQHEDDERVLPSLSPQQAVFVTGSSRREWSV